MYEAIKFQVPFIPIQMIIKVPLFIRNFKSSEDDTNRIEVKKNLIMPLLHSIASLFSSSSNFPLFVEDILAKKP